MNILTIFGVLEVKHIAYADSCTCSWLDDVSVLTVMHAYVQVSRFPTVSDCDLHVILVPDLCSTN